MIQDKGELSNRIASINNLKMVKCYSLFEKDESISGILAYYGDKTINLCSADEHFPELFDKIVKLYAKESLTAQIVVDKVTGEILERAGKSRKQEYEQILTGYRETTHSLFLPKAFAHYTVIPIVRFLLEKLYGDKEDAVHFDQINRDWFGQGVLIGECHRHRVSFPYRIMQRTDDTVVVKVNNVFHPGNSMFVEFTFGQEGITAFFREKKFSYQGNLLMQVTGQEVEFSYCILEGEKQLEVFHEDCESRTNRKPSDRAIALTAGKEVEWCAYVLPWGDVLFRAFDGAEEYRIFSVERENCNISHALVYHNVTEGTARAEQMQTEQMQTEQMQTEQMRAEQMQTEQMQAEQMQAERAQDVPDVQFGKLAFTLYERKDLVELQLLDMAYPSSAEYRMQYAGRIYQA